MNVARKKKIVLLGMMTKMPVAGVVWQTVHYLVGFQRLGYDVYYIEAHARTPSMFMTSESCDGSGKAAAFIDSVMRRFDLAGRWAYHALHEPHAPLYGLSDTQLRDLYREADLIINLHGGTEPRPEHYQTGRLIYLETDPVALQIELHDNNADTIRFLEPHAAFFTFGENLGHPDCGLPVSDRFPFKPTRQPVVMDFWENALPPGDAFTTIGNWEQQWRQVTFKGETYHWSKHFEFRKFLDLPSVTSQPFELALSSYDDTTREMLESKGWRVRHALGFSTDPDAYRDYIQRSRGEFTVAKDQNVRLRSGWFSDRSATYLAAGRPVITQDTGFGNVLPTGEGLFAFRTADELLAAVTTINSDLPRHRRAATELACECFSTSVVLPRILDAVGASRPRTPSMPARQEPQHPYDKLPVGNGTPATLLYLDLMKRCLTNWVYGESEPGGWDSERRTDGKDWPPTAHTMIGLKRLNNLQWCVEDVLARDVPGDLIETGVWRGGATIFMRAILKAHGVTDRCVWVADSFEGLPVPDPEKYPSDRGAQLHTFTDLAVPLERVRSNFDRYGLLDEQVRFLKGWFRDTLPVAPIERLAVIRLDGDMYESTIDALANLYPKLSVGGFVIVDDYGYCQNCRDAVHDFRREHGISDEMLAVDWTSVFWRRSA